MKERRDRKFPTPADSRRGFASDATEENEGQIEGRNALTEALRSGRTIDKIYVQRGERTGSLIARLDWNINSRHNLSLRYNFLDARKDEFVSSATLLRFNGEGYTSTADTHSLVAELNSRISDKFFNEVRVGYTRVHDGREAMSGALYPYVEIQKMRDGDNTSVYIGTDPFAIMNDLVQNTVTITDNFSYYADGHTITIGTHNEIFNSSCLYMANALGAYTYNTLDDFLADNPRKYVRNYAVGNPATNITSAQFGLYLQDEWSASPRFSMTYGLRADMPVVFGTPPANDAFNASDIAQKYNIKTNQVPRPMVLVSPRIGLRWRIAESAEAKSLLRGGVGIFSGRIPFVWISAHQQADLQIVCSKMERKRFLQLTLDMVSSHGN